LFFFYLLHPFFIHLGEDDEAMGRQQQIDLNKLIKEQICSSTLGRRVCRTGEGERPQGPYNKIKATTSTRHWWNAGEPDEKQFPYVFSFALFEV
jgi:hypothetical protein